MLHILIKVMLFYKLDFSGEIICFKLLVFSAHYGLMHGITGRGRLTFFNPHFHTFTHYLLFLKETCTELFQKILELIRFSVRQKI